MGYVIGPFIERGQPVDIIQPMYHKIRHFLNLSVLVKIVALKFGLVKLIVLYLIYQTEYNK